MPYLVVERKNEGMDAVVCETRYMLSLSFLDKLVGPDVPSEFIYELKKRKEIRVVRHDCTLIYKLKNRIEGGI
jgi:hypothetical protein